MAVVYGVSRGNLKEIFSICAMLGDGIIKVKM